MKQFRSFIYSSLFTRVVPTVLGNQRCQFIPRPLVRKVRIHLLFRGNYSFLIILKQRVTRLVSSAPCNTQAARPGDSFGGSRQPAFPGNAFSSHVPHRPVQCPLEVAPLWTFTNVHCFMLYISRKLYTSRKRKLQGMGASHGFPIFRVLQDSHVFYFQWNRTARLPANRILGAQGVARASIKSRKLPMFEI